MGDYNINLFNYETHELTANFVDTIFSYAFVPLINRPTRVSKHSATLIDNILTNKHNALVQCCHGILVTDISDHFPIFHINPNFTDTVQDVFILKRLCSVRNKHAFLDDLNKVDWNAIYRTQDTQEAFSQFHHVLLSLFNKNFPRKKIKIRYYNKKPWLSEGLKLSIKHKNKLYHKNLKCKTAYNEVMYKTYRNKLKHVLAKAEKDHYANLLEANKSNMKKTWGILKDIINKNKANKVQSQFKLNDGSITSNKLIISEKFNDLFINIGPTLADKIPKQSKIPESYLGSRIENSILLAPVTLTEIDDIFKTLRRCAPGYDELTTDIISLSLPCIKNPLLHIMNQSLLQGVFPNELKVANVIPLYKADDPMKFNNYRPVSLLSILSKIFEKAMYNRLTDFLETQKLLMEKQFGFRKDHSTYMALMLLVDNLIKSLENGEYVLGVFLDFSKAFDTVDHAILLSKLYHYGIRGPALTWFQSYLSGRQQFVTYNGVQSSMKVVKCGVPQGSILGPILFLVYINDLANICRNTLPFLFADDTNLFISGSNLPQIEEMLNQELQEISLWLKVNKLSLNIKKTHYMLFTNKRSTKPCISVDIDGHSIDAVEYTRFLGIYIDNKLNWKKHIAYISGKVSRGIGIILKARKILNSDAMKTLYYSFIYPFFTYCNHVWGNAYDSNLYPLVMLQKRIIRIITLSKYLDHTGPLFKELGLLKIGEINKYLLGKFMYKWSNSRVPLLFQDMFQYVRNVHGYGTRQSDHLYTPIVKTNLGKCSLRYKGPVIWNSILTAHINPDTSEAVFAKTLKHCIIIGIT